MQSIFSAHSSPSHSSPSHSSPSHSSPSHSSLSQSITRQIEQIAILSSDTRNNFLTQIQPKPKPKVIGGTQYHAHKCMRYQVSDCNFKFDETLAITPIPNFLQQAQQPYLPTNQHKVLGIYDADLQLFKLKIDPEHYLSADKVAGYENRLTEQYSAYHLGDYFCWSFAQWLKKDGTHHRCVDHDFSNNHFTSLGASYIAQALIDTHRALLSITINLSGNDIDNLGAFAFAKVIRQLAPLMEHKAVKIILDSNKISDEGAKTILRALQETIQTQQVGICGVEISMQKNPISAKIMTELNQTLAQIEQIRLDELDELRSSFK